VRRAEAGEARKAGRGGVAPRREVRAPLPARCGLQLWSSAPTQSKKTEFKPKSHLKKPELSRGSFHQPLTMQ
jgi:hypothetical protein